MSIQTDIAELSAKLDGLQVSIQELTSQRVVKELLFNGGRGRPRRPERVPGQRVVPSWTPQSFETGLGPWIIERVDGSPSGAGAV